MKQLLSAIVSRLRGESPTRAILRAERMLLLPTRNVLMAEYQTAKRSHRGQRRAYLALRSVTTECLRRPD